VGDQAVNIAVRVREMGAFANIDLPVDIPEAGVAGVGDGAQGAAGVYRGGRGSGAVGAEAGRPGGRDERCAAFYALSSLIKEKPELTPQSLNALIIARNLERVGDHATNIAEDVIFWVRGADVRHFRDLHGIRPLVFGKRDGASSTWQGDGVHGGERERGAAGGRLSRLNTILRRAK
jgi:phosphate transport system protein